MIELLNLTGPDRQTIAINPMEIVSIRAPRSNEHFGHGIHCIITTADGKFTAVVETCKEIEDALARR